MLVEVSKKLHKKIIYPIIGIFCGDCASESWLLPQFGQMNPERICKYCIETQVEIFDLHNRLMNFKSELKYHNLKYQKLINSASVLQVGAMFQIYTERGFEPKKLALSDDLLMIAIINKKLNKVDNAYDIDQIAVNPGVDEFLKVSKGMILTG